MRNCLVFATIVAASVCGCKVNGKAVGWPGKGGGDATSENGGEGGSSDSSDSSGSSDGAQTASQVTNERPAWCNVDGAEDLSSGGVKYTLEDDNVRDQVYDLIGNFCAERPATERRDELAALHAKVSKSLMMNDADWRDAVEWAMAPQGQRNGPSIRPEDKKALSKMDPIEQYGALSSTYGSIDFLADELEPVLTETGRMGYVERCMRSDDVGEWAICHEDVLKFDPAKVAAEIRGAKNRSAFERTAVRLQMAFLRPKVAERIAAVNKLKKKDPGYAKLFQVAAEARKAWKPGREFSDIALAMADAKATNSRSAFAGCLDKTWGAFSKAVAAAVPAKRFGEIVPSQTRSFMEKAASVALDHPAVYLSAYAFIRCAQGSDVKEDVLMRTLGSEMAWRPGLRGPRTAAHTAALAANIQLDDRDAKIGFPSTNHTEEFPRATGWNGGGQGVVAKVDASGDKVTIGFAKQMATYQECTHWKRTHRIDRIDQNGQIHYEEYCTKSRTKRYNKASQPQTVAARYAARVAKGKQVSVIENLVVQVRAKKGGDPIAVFGVPVN